jgi:hypothetical protein
MVKPFLSEIALRAALGWTQALHNHNGVHGESLRRKNLLRRKRPQSYLALTGNI